MARIDLQPIDSGWSGDLTLLRFRVLNEPGSARTESPKDRFTPHAA